MRVFKVLAMGTGAILLVLVGVALVFATDLEREKVEQPKYEVVAEKDGYEIRRYAPYIMAQVVMKDDADAAMNGGFRPLADFIFGNNTKESDIAMTSPVTQQPAASQKIAMTSPVTQQPDEDGHVVSFIMPSEYTLESIPKPNNDNVTLTPVDAQVLAVIQFSGWGDHETMLAKEEELRGLLEEDGIEITGDPTYARYDPPWTLPSLRKNEVMLPVKLE